MRQCAIARFVSRHASKHGAVRLGMGGVEDYPEHLNPFREEKKNKFSALGRRKLRAVLSLTSWSLFPWRKSKSAEKDGPSVSGGNRFLTMTPRLSRHLLERLSKRKPRSASLAPASNPATSTGQRFSYTEFRIMPKSSREKFAVRRPRERQEVLESSYLWADRSSAPDLTLSSSSTSPVSEVCGDDEPHATDTLRYSKQGAKPKKKRPAPPPPSSESPADQRHVNTTAETEVSLASPTESKNIDVSLHETPPTSNNDDDGASVNDSATTSHITCVLVHEPSPTSNHISASTQETSNNTSASTHETPLTSSISVSIHETSATSNVSVSTHETSETSNISASIHETSITSNYVSVSNHETSITSNTNALIHETSVTSNISVPAHETSITSNNINETEPACSTAKNLCVSLQETPETSPTPNEKSVSVHETYLETSLDSTTPDSDAHREVTPTTCKL